MKIYIKIVHFIDYIKYVENWHDIIMLRGGIKNKALIRFRNNPRCPIVLSKDNYATFSGLVYLLAKGASYDPCNDTVYVYYNNKKLVFTDIMKNSFDSSITNSLLEIFYDDEYKFLDVDGKIVVDVGASIGDTPIYFIARGAKRVIAYEPIPYVCDLMKKNVKLNNMSDVIDINCSAVVANVTESKMKLCVYKRGHTLSHPVNFSKVCRGEIIEAPVTSIPRADVLKIDCEGCEFDIILNMHEPVYYEIGIEYHDTPKRLIAKLEELGYSVRLIREKVDSSESSEYREVGILHAKLKK